jgi:signal transduction histidine kinase
VDALQDRTTSSLQEHMQRGLALTGERFGQLLAFKQGELIIEYTEGDEPRTPIVEIKKLDSGEWAPITGRCAMKQQVINVADVFADPGYIRFLGEEMKSELVVPLIAQGETIGMINLESPVPNYFVEEHVRILQPIASYAAVAIYNARTAEREKKAAIFTRTGQLIHKLNNPLGAIKARISLIKMMRPELLEQDTVLAQGFNEINQNVERVLAEVRSVKETAPESLVPVVVQDILLDALKRVTVPENIAVVTQFADALPAVQGTVKLTEVFINLIENAVNAMPNGGHLDISSKVDESGASVNIFVRDTGVGIPTSLWDEVFEPWVSSRKGETNGLGLWWTREFVKRCGGALQIWESQAGKGTCFRVSLPVAV